MWGDVEKEEAGDRRRVGKFRGGKEDEGKVVGRCEACSKLSPLVDPLSVDTTDTIFRALLLPPEDTEAGASRRGLRICADCTSSLGTFTDLRSQLEEQRVKFNYLRRRLGKGVLLGRMGRSEEALELWGEEVAKAEYIFPSGLEATAVEEEEEEEEEVEVLMEFKEEVGTRDSYDSSDLDTFMLEWEEGELERSPAVEVEGLDGLEETSHEAGGDDGGDDGGVEGEVRGEPVTSGEKESADLTAVGGEEDDVFSSEISSDEEEELIPTPNKADVSSPPLCPEVSPPQIRRSSRSHKPKRFFEFEKTCSVQKKTAGRVRDIHSNKGKALGANFKSQAAVCPKCGKTFSYERNVARHLRDVHGNLKRRPSVSRPVLRSAKTFSKGSKLNRHARRVYNKMTSVVDGRRHPHFKCPSCPLFFRRKYQLLNHRRLAHNNNNSLPSYMKRRQCGICARVFSSVAHLHTHERQCHSVFPRVSCTHCEMSFSDPLILKQHRLRRHFLGSTDAGDAQCSKCLKFFHSQRAMEIHRDENHSPDTCCFLCQNSPAFLTSAELKTHEESEEHVKKIRSKGAVHCNACRLNFGGNLEDLQIHLKSPQHLKEVDTLGKFDEATFCVPCRQNFDTWEVLLTHNNSVAHEKVCQFRENVVDDISSDSQLQEENATPADAPPVDVPVSCDLCGETFKRQRRLDRHIRLWHIPPKENCKICGLPFRYLMDYHRH